MRGRGLVVLPGRSGLVPVRRSGPGPVRLAGGGRGRIYQAIRRLYRAHKTPPARLADGPGLLAGGVLARRFSIAAAIRPASAPRSGPPLAPGAGPAWSFSGVVPVLWWARSFGWLRSLLPVPLRRGPSLARCRSSGGRGPLVPVRLQVRRGHFRKQPRFFRPLHRAENFQRFFRRGILCARSKS